MLTSVASTTHVGSSGLVGAAVARETPREKPAAQDTVQLSHAATKAVDPPIREKLVERVRAEIADGTYETDEKLNVAIDRMLRDVMRG